MSDAAHSISAKPAVVADFNWEDPLDLEGQLTEEERMIRELYEPLHDLYREITGEDYSDPVGMQFRKLDDLGPLCSGCGKPLRTPLAAKCL